MGARIISVSCDLIESILAHGIGAAVPQEPIVDAQVIDVRVGQLDGRVLAGVGRNVPPAGPVAEVVELLIESPSFIGGDGEGWNVDRHLPVFVRKG